MKIASHSLSQLPFDSTLFIGGAGRAAAAPPSSCFANHFTGDRVVQSGHCSLFLIRGLGARSCILILFTPLQQPSFISSSEAPSPTAELRLQQPSFVSSSQLRLKYLCMKIPFLVVLAMAQETLLDPALLDKDDYDMDWATIDESLPNQNLDDTDNIVYDEKDIPPIPKNENENEQVWVRVDKVTSYGIPPNEDPYNYIQDIW
ncbi:hypothetical protein SLEP1_g12099 [Rubroshorea leprosula]|nr:hypothetical protein SLEP1_g12099 [Rubroshorea leprosula]